MEALVQPELQLSLAQRLALVRERLERACQRAGRDPQSVRLVGVSKTKSLAVVEEAVRAGLRDFGENYVQELQKKAPKVPGVNWHLVGPLQKNKVKKAVAVIDFVHSLDSLDIILLAERRARELKRRLQGLIQVHLGDESTKSGLGPQEVIPLLESLTMAPPNYVSLVGLMTIPPPGPPERIRPYFRQLRQLLQEIEERKFEFWRGCELSMGMSDDFEVAIEEGATMVRVGRAIFGPRQYKQQSAEVQR